MARYCSPRTIRDDRPLLGAFSLRLGEYFLSTNWLEHFHESERPVQMFGVRQTLSDKGFQVSANGRFAVLNVGHSSKLAVNIQLSFRVLGQASDPSHTGIFGYQAGDADTAIALSQSVQELHPAVQ